MSKHIKFQQSPTPFQTAIFFYILFIYTSPSSHFKFNFFLWIINKTQARRRTFFSFTTVMISVTKTQRHFEKRKKFFMGGQWSWLGVSNADLFIIIEMSSNFERVFELD